MDEVIATLKINASAQATLSGENVARDRMLIIRALEQTLDWLGSHSEVADLSPVDGDPHRP